VVAATNRDLQSAAERGEFRRDLYFRLAVFPLVIPPLRERGDDIALLARHFAARFGTELRRREATLSEEALELLRRHDWPGNVRELENVIKRAVIMADAAAIRAADLGLGAAGEAEAFNLRQVRDQAERMAVVRALGRVNGNLSRAAELLGVSRPTLYDLMNRFGIKSGRVGVAEQE
jgi:two-component system NtrC family response regulator